MTVSYNSEVATSSFARFWRLLFRWRGSVFKLLWKDTLIFGSCYVAICLTDAFVLSCDQRKTFYRISLYCQQWRFQIPLTFLLAFFVSLVLQRWWEQVELLPFPDSIAFQVTANIAGHDKRGKILRRSLVRYVNLACVLKVASISPPVKKRFPTVRHLVEPGLLTQDEARILAECPIEHPPYQVPIIWASSLCLQAFRENRIDNVYALRNVLDAIFDFRGHLGFVGYYDWINIPLVYLQVVSVAIHAFFLAHIFGQHVEVQPGVIPCRAGTILQASSNVTFVDNFTANSIEYYNGLAFTTTAVTQPQLKSTSDDLDLEYLRARVELFVKPFFILFQFMFFMGWLKVAEALVNPFGEDDDDIEMNWIIDRNRNISYRVVDDLHAEHPDLMADDVDERFFDPRLHLPLTLATADENLTPFAGSAAGVVVPPQETAWIYPLETIQEGEMEETEREPPVTGPERKNGGLSKKSLGKDVACGTSSPTNLSTNNAGTRLAPASSSGRSGSIENKIPAVIVTKKEMEKGRLFRPMGVSDLPSRLVEAKRVTKNAPRMKTPVCDSDSLASLAARKHRKALECRVKRSAPPRESHQFEDRLSQSSAPSGKAFLLGRLHQSLQKSGVDPPSTPELNVSDDGPDFSDSGRLSDSVATSLSKTTPKIRADAARGANVSGVNGDVGGDMNSERVVSEWTPSSSHSSLVLGNAGARRFEERFLELNFMRTKNRRLPAQRPSSFPRCKPASRFPFRRKSTTDDGTGSSGRVDAPSRFDVRRPALDDEATPSNAEKIDETPLGSASALERDSDKDADKDAASASYFADDSQDGERTITAEDDKREASHRPSLADIQFEE